LKNFESVDEKKAEDFKSHLYSKYALSQETKILINEKSKLSSRYRSITLKNPQDLASNFIFIPLQIPNDYVIKNYSPISVFDFIKEIGRWACKNKKQVVFKPHPFSFQNKEIFNALYEVKKGNDYVEFARGHIQNLISKSSSVWVINSGVGFEAFIHSKPVVTFGECDYSFCTIEGSLAHLSDVFKKVEECDLDHFKKQSLFLYRYIIETNFYLDKDYIEHSKKRLISLLERYYIKGIL